MYSQYCGNCQLGIKKLPYMFVISVTPKPFYRGGTHQGAAECCSQGDWIQESRSAGVRSESTPNK